MRLLVCGGRDFNDLDFICLHLCRFNQTYPVDQLIHGGARGADHWAGQWATALGIPVDVYPANWNRDGRAAGPLRNERMLREGRPDAIFAFPGSTGTGHMWEISRNVGIRIRSNWIRFRKEDPIWGWLSNFSPNSFTVDNLEWPTVEHYYQSRKVIDPDSREAIRICSTPDKARQMGRAMAERADWNRIKEEMMAESLRLKFRDPDLRQRLRDSHPHYLVEHAPWDSYWGNGADGRGANRLGHLLMEVREEIFQTDAANSGDFL